MSTEGRRHNLIGQRFGRLVVIERAENDKNNHTVWKCQCDCGKTKNISANSLRTGRSKSCGCVAAIKAQQRMKTHGETKTRLYKIWANMKTRCNDEKNKGYKNYGARGISICEEWNNSFETFRDWAISNGYNNNLTIDRINVDGNYEPNNCRWVTYKIQANNKTNNHVIEFNSEKHTMAEWADIIGIEQNTLERRLNKRHWSVEKALTTPLISREVTDHKGNVFKTQGEMCKFYNISNATYSARRKRGWDLESALTLKIDSTQRYCRVKED